MSKGTSLSAQIVSSAFRFTDSILFAYHTVSAKVFSMRRKIEGPGHQDDQRHQYRDHEGIGSGTPSRDRRRRYQERTIKSRGSSGGNGLQRLPIERHVALDVEIQGILFDGDLSTLTLHASA